ncbi:transposase-like protein [Paenalcaligenes hominis]|uniref:Transposase-like protein n=2 Tax=Paenalcaligenes hominis TaxID=643674 RepID=A0ABX0WP65_9BURK|nr:hypothetical protein [Paenalcaligenes hominis]NJB64579.1 transposase-like protein [Paenalcaligenes hominis]
MHNESLSAYQASSQFDGISPSSILKWKRLYEYGLLDGQEETLAMTKKVYRPDRKKPDTEKTPEELLRELQYMRAEVAFLKKWNELGVQEQKKRLTTNCVKKRPK